MASDDVRALAERLKDCVVDRDGDVKLDDCGRFITAAQAIHALARAVLAQETRPTWQPIETAPKDGTWMLLVGARWVVDGPVVGAWSSDHGGYWHDCERGITGVTHWMPLPAAPEAALAPEQEER